MSFALWCYSSSKDGLVINLWHPKSQKEEEGGTRGGGIFRKGGEGSGGRGRRRIFSRVLCQIAAEASFSARRNVFQSSFHLSFPNFAAILHRASEGAPRGIPVKNKGVFVAGCVFLLFSIQIFFRAFMWKLAVRFRLGEEEGLPTCRGNW